MHELAWRMTALAAQLLVIAVMVLGAWRAAGRMVLIEPGDRIPATGILVLSACVVINILLGSCGLLTPVALFTSSIAVGGTAAWWGRTAAPAQLGPVGPRSAASPSPLSYLAIGVGVLVLPNALRAMSHVPVAWDELTYHMLKPAVWLYDTRLSRPGLPHPISWLEYYPANGELVWTTLVGVAKNDLLVHSLNVPLLGALATCVVQLSRACGASSGPAWALAGVLATLPVVLGYIPTAYVECILNVAELSAVLFGLRWLRTKPGDGGAYAILCGLACGLAIGTKYAALPIIATVVIACVVGKCWVDGLRRCLLREAVWACAAGLATGAYWYARNWLEAGNPFYPVPWMGLPHADDPALPWQGSSILSNFIYLTLSGELSLAWFAPHSGFLSAPGMSWFGGALLLFASLGVVSTATRVIRLRSSSPRESAIYGLLCASMLTALVTYLRLPFWGHRAWLFSQVRFIVPFLSLSISDGLAALEGKLSTRWIYLLAAIGLVSNASQLNLTYPKVDESWSLALSIAVFGVCASLLHARLLGRGLLRGAAILSLCSLPFVLEYREQLRFDQLRNIEEVHHSRHQSLVNCAEAVAETFSGKKVAVVQPSYEFDALFTGRHFDIRPIYVSQHAGPNEPYHYANGDARHASDEQTWKRNLRASGAAALVVTDVLGNSAYRPAEIAWMRSIPAKPLRCGTSVLFDLRTWSSTRTSSDRTVSAAHVESSRSH